MRCRRGSSAEWNVAAQQAALVVAFVLAAAPPGSADEGVRYVSPTGSGTRSGRSAQDAGTIANLSSLIAAAGPGGRVLLLADRGPYALASRAALRAIQFRSRARTATAAPRKRRSPAPARNRAEQEGCRRVPKKRFACCGGADHLRFGARVRECGQRRVPSRRGHRPDLGIRDVSARNVARFLENNASGRRRRRSIDGLTIARVTSPASPWVRSG